MTEQSEETSETVGVETPVFPTVCIGCGQPNPTAAHIAGCSEAQRKLSEPIRFAFAPAETPYADAVEEYLEAATWLGPADAPLKVHARSIAKSLDKQLADRAEIQSALASSFDKVLYRLDARRPAARPPAPALGDDDGEGTPSMFGFLSD